MGKVIICETTEAVIPYTFENTGVMVYSYEELCYYIYHNVAMLGKEPINSKLIDWIKGEINLKELAVKLNTMVDIGEKETKIYKTILEAKQYYNQEEIDFFIESLVAYDGLSDIEKIKMKADSFLLYKRYNKAYVLYESLLENEELIEDKRLLGNIIHNVAVCEAKNMELENAKNNFLKAYMINHNMESLREYFFILFVRNEDELIISEEKRFNLSPDFCMDIKDEVDGAKEDVIGLETYKKLDRAIYNKNHGQLIDYNKRIEGILDKWKEEYREQTI